MALLRKLQHLFASSPADPAIAGLYRAAVAQARMPEFYQELGVPDTVEGRFDLLVLHVFLIMRRCGGRVDVTQHLFDLMFADIDQNLREMGVGDMGIGRKMKAMIAAFYGRTQAYEKALAGDDATLGAVLARNLYGAATPSTGIINRLTAYIRRSVAKLDEQPLADVLEGSLSWPGQVRA